VISALKPSTVLDLGCGTGQSLDYFLSKGVDVFGVEGSKLAISRALHPERITPYNLNNELNLGKKFDLVWSFEFVEHIHPDYVHNLIRSFSNHSDTVVLSAAFPGQGGDGHYNEQPAEYWIEKFAAAGFGFNEPLTAQLKAIVEDHSENMLVFRR
jgi:cyclopropane fatty-acyl-phospholipid synthase-like methyltransferase